MEQYGIEAVLNAHYKYQSCLQFASLQNSDPSLVWFLLAKGADPNGVNIKGWETPLVAASKSGMLPIIDILLAYRADASLFYSHALREVYPGSYELQRKVARKLLQHGADPDATDPNSDDEVMRKSPFMHAVYKMKLGLVRELAKWKETIPSIEEKDIQLEESLKRHSGRNRYLSQIRVEIKNGENERQQLLGNSLRIKWIMLKVPSQK